MNRTCHGFTVIELMIAMTILAILMGIATPSFNTWIADMRVRSTVESIVAGFQVAKNEALRRNSGVRITLNVDSSWNVGCDVPDDNDANGDGLPDCPAVIKSRSASDGSQGIAIAVTPAGSTSALYTGFGRVKTGVEIPITSVDVPANPQGVHQLRIQISGGSVKTCDPSVAAGDPRAC